MPLATSVLERGGVTPWLPPDEMRKLGFNMILYPTTILFGLVRSIENRLSDLRAAKPLDSDASVDMEGFEQLADLDIWARIEKEFPVGQG